jgi:transposase-like protein
VEWSCLRTGSNALEVFVSHANAALTPLHRLRLARLIVEHGWPVARAAERYDVSWPTAKRWADRYRRLGPAGMADASCRPHHSPNRTPAPVVRKIVHLRWKQRLGPVQIADQVGLAPSTVHAVLVRCRLNRLSHVDRATGEPIRRYQHEHPGDLLHVDVKKLGNVPDGGGWRYLGRQRGAQSRLATKTRTGITNVHHNPKVGTAFVHTVLDDCSRVAYAEIHDDETAATAALMRPWCCATRWPGSPTAASPSIECSPTTAAPTAHACGATPARSSASSTSEPGPTGPRPTAKSNASTAPWPTAGPSRSSTTPNQHAAQPCQHGSTSTTITGPTPPSDGQRPSAA